MPLTTLPSVGFGTWQLEGDTAREGVADALALGYRHIDTARAYGNEREVGAALRESGVPREEVWVTTKVFYDDLEPDRVRRSAEASLRDLGLDRVDLLLVHWPNPSVRLGDTLNAMHRLRQDGATRHIGVANFPSRLLRQAVAEFPIFCNQVEYHPYLEQRAVLDAAHAHRIVVTAYSPLGSGGLLGDPVLAEIAAARGCSTAQVALRWLLDQSGVAAIPRASSPEHRAENLAALDIAPLTYEERARVDALTERRRRFIDPSFAPAWDN